MGAKHPFFLGITTIPGKRRHKTMDNRFAIVGQFHRPPASQVLNIIPIGYELVLVPEPDNKYDPKAIKVGVDLTNLPTEFVAELEKELRETEFEASTIIAEGIFHLGYIPNSDNPKTTRGGPGNREAGAIIAAGDFKACFNTFSNGFPCVEIAGAEEAPAA
jgi:hypothetical protein